MFVFVAYYGGGGGGSSSVVVLSPSMVAFLLSLAQWFLQGFVPVSFLVPDIISTLLLLSQMGLLLCYRYGEKI